jgi:hypothetical protein
LPGLQKKWNSVIRPTAKKYSADLRGDSTNFIGVGEIAGDDLYSARGQIP